jgi:hypothetical protein
MKKSILTIAIMLVIAFMGLEAKPKAEKVKIDPEFEKFWSDFKTNLFNNKLDALQNNTLFPLIWRDLSVQDGEYSYFTITREKFIKTLGDELIYQKDNIKKGKISINEIPKGSLIIDKIDEKQKTTQLFNGNNLENNIIKVSITKKWKAGIGSGYYTIIFNFSKKNGKYFLVVIETEKAEFS